MHARILGGVSEAPPPASETKRQRALRWLGSVALASLVLTFFVHQVLLTVFVVEGVSMEPTLRPGQRLLVWRTQALERGDLAVFRNPNRPEEVLVKRVLGVPGDRIELRRGRVYRNGDEVREPYLKPGSGDGRAERVVQPESYYLLGDNRAESVDSRRLGLIPGARVIGRVIRRF